ncbi:DUF1771-domain-containing protein [Suhomyces tanzawaensis NRRL Y-17324]|uniref:DUF1771-domain-containing protein n=1 Tax=Suhomyces tanzawaensis NRRL Y-17324 TaxID=984487 RepID=A0A1E4SNQ8_9ASCO|nr:DUF1771-domain-containing protein [Suhomyces tanzawaensis NRRL Y-17324]ODV81143.1 DUF1771-domain-containing protein [Suhomyces tanzawaensis NRRL Y-17324]
MDRGVHLGGGERDYNHATDSEYKKLRDEADQLYKKRNQLSQESQLAFKSGDKQRAHELSEKAKSVLAQAERANQQAAEYVFRENNADSAADEIDLHGLYVKEAEFILQNRLAAAIRTNQSHLRVIVGKGLHSQNGIAKLKPAIDQMCDDCNLKHRIDPKNTGVMIIDLTNTQSNQIPNHWNTSGPSAPQKPQGYQGQQQYQGTGQPQYYQQQPQHQQQGVHTGNPIVDFLFKAVCACINSK